ncbi:MAG TPA: A24 family peptidase [Thermogutta sp.]|nr:A24 family peptidase [Thermogutta sp.]
MWPALPTWMCWTLLVVGGAIFGAAANWLADALAWQPRRISPFFPTESGRRRRPIEYLPILGWLFRTGDSERHGRFFWIRPLAVELVCAVAIPLLYWWEVIQAGLVPSGVPRPADGVLHAMFARHLLLIFFMLVASLIDWDEKLIPDSVTIPGTLLALILAASLSTSQLPHGIVHRAVFLGDDVMEFGKPEYSYLTFSAPYAWPKAFGGQPHGHGLSLGLACWWLWCFALMPRRWYRRKGFWKSLKMMCARLYRSRVTGGLVVMGLIGSAGILFTWIVGGSHWQALLSALVGMAASALLAWVVRLVGSMVLDREALGFGDVTLMAMLGAYLGWQPGIILFFLAPFAGLVVAIIILILRRETEIPYGPFLCLGALVTIVFWRPIWGFASRIFELGFILLLLAAACLVLLALLLLVIRFIRERLFGV